MKHQTYKNNKGFSLVELIIVIAILAILAGFLAVLYVQHLKEARAAVCLENRDRLYKEMNAKYADGTYDSLEEAYNKLMENYKDRKLCPSKGTYSWEANGDGINQIICSVHGAPSDTDKDNKDSGKTFPGTDLAINSGVWPKSEDFKDNYEEILYHPSGIFEYEGSYYVITKDLTLTRERAASGPGGEVYPWTSTEKLTGKIYEMTDEDERISGIKRGDLVKYKDSYYVYNSGDGPEGSWAPNPNTGSNVWYKIPK